MIYNLLANGEVNKNFISLKPIRLLLPGLSVHGPFTKNDLLMVTVVTQETEVTVVIVATDLTVVTFVKSMTEVS